MISNILTVDVAAVAGLSLNVVSNVRGINSLVVYSILARSVPAILCRGLQCVAVGRILAGVNEEYVRLIIIIADVDVVACSLSCSLLNVEASVLAIAALPSTLEPSKVPFSRTPFWNAYQSCRRLRRR